MKVSRAGLTLLISLLLVATSGCNLVNRIRAKNELNEAAKAAKSGHFEDAERHSRIALELDPDSRVAPLFIARTIHAQYHPGVEKPENIQIAERAIAAYKDILVRDPLNDEAFKATVALLKGLKRDDDMRNLISSRANDGRLSDGQRSDAFFILASLDWDCSYKITELATSQRKVPKGDKVVIEYIKPKDPKDYDRAVQCVTRGMEEAEKAISLSADSEFAWSYKTNLLREKSKLAEMDGKTDQVPAIDKEAERAQLRTTELNKRNEERKKAEEAAKSPAAK